MESKDVEILKNIARELLKKSNKSGKTPTMELIEKEKPVFKAASRLFSLNLVDD